MRTLVIGILVLVAAGCDGTDPLPLVPVAELGIEATYEPAWCYIGSGGGAPPCTTYYSPSGQIRLDSARAVFSRDGTVTWKAAYWQRSCIYPNGTCQETITTRFENATGTYSIDDTGVTLALSGDGRSWPMRFHSTVPSAVPSSWIGPDSLRVGLSSQSNYSVAFTSKAGVP